MSADPNASNSTTPTWSFARVATLALVSLALGVPIGYVVRGSSSPAAAATTTATAPDSSAPAAPHSMPSDDQMKHMADKQAEPLVEQLKKTPDDAAVLANVGKTYLKARQFETAAHYYERSASIKPNADVLTTLGGVYYYSGAKAKAVDAWSRALKVDPNHADALVNIGLSKWHDDGDAKGAVEIWKRMLKLNPKHPHRLRVEQMIAQAEKHAGITASSGQ